MTAKDELTTREKHYGKCHSAKTGSPRRLRNRAFKRDDTNDNMAATRVFLDII